VQGHFLSLDSQTLWEEEKQEDCPTFSLVIVRSKILNIALK